MPSLPLGGMELRLRAVPTVAAAAGIALTLALGAWQLDRAAGKQALQDRYAERARGPAVTLGAHDVQPADLDLRRVEARGEFQPAHMIYLDNRIHDKVPGYHVLVPLKLAGSTRHVLVNRGWIAANRDRRELPRVATPAGEVTVTGIATLPSDRFLELSPEVVEGRVWQNLAFQRYRDKTGLDLQPLVILQDAGGEDALVRDWPAPDYGRKTHLAYAFQWFALALAILVYYLVTNVRRKPESS